MLVTSYVFLFLEKIFLISDIRIVAALSATNRWVKFMKLNGVKQKQNRLV